MTKETINTGTKSANKPTDLKRFDKTTQIVKKTKGKKKKKSISRSKSQFANKSQQKKNDSIHGRLFGVRRDEQLRRDEMKHVWWATDSTGSAWSRAAPPTLQHWAPVFPYLESSNPGGHGRAAGGNPKCRASSFSRSLKVSSKNLIQQSSYCIADPLSTRCVSSIAAKPQ